MVNRLPIIGTAVLAVALSSPVAADEWSKSFEVSGVPAVEIEADDANVVVTTWEKHEINVLVTTHGWKIGSDGIRVRASQDGERVRIEVLEPNFRLEFFRRKEALIELQMPSTGSLEIVTGDGNVRVGSLRGELDVRTGDGHISVRDLDGEMALHTGDGNINVRDVTGAVAAHSGDGRIEISGIVGALDLQSSDGSILVEAFTGSSIGDGWHIRTGDGTLTLRLPESLAANIDARTGDGHITSEVPIRAIGEIKSRSLRGELNGGGPPIRLSSNDGNIRIQVATATREE